jgi:glycerol-3-phosphate dehydrogenase
MLCRLRRTSGERGAGISRSMEFHDIAVIGGGINGTGVRRRLAARR